MLNSYPPQNGPIPTLLNAQAPNTAPTPFTPKPMQPYQPPQQQGGAQNSMLNQAITSALKNPAGGTPGAMPDPSVPPIASSTSLPGMPGAGAPPTGIPPMTPPGVGAPPTGMPPTGMPPTGMPPMTPPGITAPPPQMPAFDPSQLGLNFSGGY